MSSYIQHYKLPHSVYLGIEYAQQFYVARNAVFKSNEPNSFIRVN